MAGQRDPLLMVAKDDCSVLLLQAGAQVYEGGAASFPF